MRKFMMSKERFQSLWLRHFADGISESKLKKCYVDQFIWHIFSWELVKNENLLVGDEARLAFDQVDKSSVICCDKYGGEGVKNRLPAKYQTAAKIDKWTIEYYVVSQDYSWTYIKTHEGDLCGPYFYRKSEENDTQGI